MFQKLLRSCALLWIFGIVGMWAARVLLDCGITGSPFRVAAGCWVLGGIGFTCCALLGLIDRSEPGARVSRERRAPADLSLLVRRR